MSESVKPITCESLRVVNKDGKPVVSLESDTYGGVITLYHVLGISELKLQMGKDGGEISISKHDKTRIGLFIDYENGAITISNQAGNTAVKIGAIESVGKGFVETYSKEGVTQPTGRIPENANTRDHNLILAEAISSILSAGEDGDWPINRFIIRRNWEQSDPRMTTVNDIFEKYDTAHRNGENVNWGMLEGELKHEFNWGYETVKDLVRAFWDSGLWQDVCREYAKTHECVEFGCIIKSQ